MQERAVVDRLARAQPRVERGNATLRLDAKRRGEIQLVHVAGADPFVNRRDASCILGFAEGELRDNLRFGLYRSVSSICSVSSKALQLRRLAIRKAPGCVIEGVAPLVDSEPRQRLAMAACAHPGLRLKAVAALVGEESRRAPARGHGALNLRKQPGNLRCLPRGADTLGSREQARPGSFIAFGVVLFSAFEQHRGRRLLHQRIDLRGNGKPAIHVRACSQCRACRPALREATLLNGQHHRSAIGYGGDSVARLPGDGHGKRARGRLGRVAWTVVVVVVERTATRGSQSGHQSHQQNQ